MKRTKLACYASSAAMAAAAYISPMLFITFRNLYGISYTKLGLLVTVFFFTQLAVDLLFSFFSHKFNIKLTVKLTPVIAVLGLLLYSLAPTLFPNNVYLGLLVGTLVFSSSAGLGEVLISPVIAAMPSKDPDREMSKLHSVYAWGTVGVVIISTLFILAFGGENWQYLALLFAVIPLVAVLLFAKAEIPDMDTPKKVSGVLNELKNKKLWLCVFAIFLGGASECTMAQWGSGFIERALGINKLWGDIFGVAGFGLALALGRTFYAKYGKNITRVLFFGALGATVCYFVAAFSQIETISLIACALTGLCTSMLWPGTLVVMQEYCKNAGVFMFAMMAAGGDCGASLGPQLVGVITDFVSANVAPETLDFIAYNPESLGMRLGILVGALFPIIAVFVFGYIKRDLKKRNS